MDALGVPIPLAPGIDRSADHPHGVCRVDLELEPAKRGAAAS
jgi:hypothetical protein